MTGLALPLFQNIAKSNPPSIAPLVHPLSSKATFNTEVTSRLR
jgi:hypothetical protein